MSDYAEQKINQLRLILSDYQSELDAIDIETDKEKARILSAIESEELEIKSLLEQYRQIKRHKEIDKIRSSYESLTQFKQNLVLKIRSESQSIDTQNLLSDEQPQASNYESLQLDIDNPQQSDREEDEPLDSTVAPTVIPDANPEIDEVNASGVRPALDEDATHKSSPLELSARGTVDDDGNLTAQEIDQENQLFKDPEVEKLIQFVEERSASEIVKLYPADVSQIIGNFDLNNATVRDRLLKHYRQRDLDIYKSLVKLYQKPNLAEFDDVPTPDSLSEEDRKYHEFLQANYPLSLPFFWFLIDREPDSIKYVVMEFAIDHIIQTNTLAGDPHRRELSLRLPELLEMNNDAPLKEFLRDLFICFHPQRVSQKANSRNKYFDYMDSLITTQSTLQYSDVLLMWNYMKKSGYSEVSSPEFDLTIPTADDSQNNHKSLAPNGDLDIL